MSQDTARRPWGWAYVHSPLTASVCIGERCPADMLGLPNVKPVFLEQQASAAQDAAATVPANLLTAFERRNFRAPKDMADAAAMAANLIEEDRLILAHLKGKLEKQQAAPTAAQPDPEAVICPACCHQFRAIPTQVQGLLLASGHEPPFLSAPAPQAPALVSLTDADRRDAEAYRRINTPEVADFLAGVHNEALHQRERWGAEGDAGKTDADWFWLVGYLAGKAIRPDATPEKQLHHIITTAAALLNWHAARIGAYAAMRPGIDPVAHGITADAAKGRQC